MEHRQRHPCSRIRCSRNRCARISASASSPAPERGADPRRPRYAPGCTRRSRSHRQCRQKARAAAHNAPPPWPFSFAAPSPACHLPGLPDQQHGTRWALCRPGEKLESARGALDTVHGYCAHRLHREGSAPPAPHQMTTQPISCTACPLPTASSQQRQTSQQPAPAACTYQQHQRTPQPCRLPAAADQHHPRPPNGPKPAHRGPLPEGSDSLPDRHIDFAV